MQLLAHLFFIGLASAAAIDMSPNTTDSNLVTKRDFTPILALMPQPVFCPYDPAKDPQPLLSYDNATAAKVEDCVAILDYVNAKRHNNIYFANGLRGYWTLDVSDDTTFIIMQFGTCKFRLRKSQIGGFGGGQNGDKFGFSFQDLNTYLGGWLEKQRHGLLHATGETDCWVGMKKEEGGVRVKWTVGNGNYD